MVEPSPLQDGTFHRLSSIVTGFSSFKLLLLKPTSLSTLRFVGYVLIDGRSGACWLLCPGKSSF
ncbi:hypothetical protein SDJN02_16412, partial [Cucurbita argyrosperma subsp. argyrosperma]